MVYLRYFERHFGSTTHFSESLLASGQNFEGINSDLEILINVCDMEKE